MVRGTLTRKSARNVITGTKKIINATVRHAMIVLRKNIKNSPDDVPKFVYPINMPRSDGSLEKIERKVELIIP